MSNNKVFNDIISDYAFARPGYPNELYFDIINFAALNKDTEILEIGSGPGQATDYFVKGGYSITGLEIGNKQVDYLSDKYAKYQNFSAICSSFEDYETPDNTFSLIFSATAFHWVAPEIGYPKAYRLLKKGGVLAVFWHMSSIIRQPNEICRELTRIYRKYAPELDTYISTDESVALHKQRIADIQTKGLFGLPIYKKYNWNDEYTTDRLIKLLNSYSDMHEISEDKRHLIFSSVSEYVENNGGKVIVPQEVWLYMVKK